MLGHKFNLERIRELRVHLTPIRIAIIKNTNNDNSVENARGGGGRREPSYTWWEYKLVQPLWKSIWRFLNKPKTELP
jgi:hypothetical protein